MKIAVVTDSGSGFTKQNAEAEGIYFLPLQIVDEETTYLDGIDTSTEQIFSMLKEGKMMKTSLPPLGMIESLLKQLKKEGYEHVICIPLTSGLSSTAHSIMMTAEMVEIPLTCIETYTTCYIQQYLARAAKRLVDEGVELEEIITRLKDCVACSNTLIIPDDLDHLKRGGRLTPLAAALGGMLKIKPILKLNESCEGKIDTLAKVRTMSKALSTAVDTFVEENKIDENYEIACMHVDAKETADQLSELYFSKFPQAHSVKGLIAPVLSVHTGIGCVGIQYIKKV